MNVFEAVKQSVTTRQAAEHYGVRVGRTGMCVCPFHNDKNPSMKVDRRFHCFGCQADGDVIDFVSRLEAVSPKEAALMLAQEFSIPYEDKEPSHSRSQRKPRQETPEQRFRRMERGAVRLSKPAAPLETGLCPQHTRRGFPPFVCGSPAKTGLCGLSAGCAALPGYGGTGSLYHRLWKGSEQS